MLTRQQLYELYHSGFDRMTHFVEQLLEHLVEVERHVGHLPEGLMSRMRSKSGDNQIKIAVTNVWANRLIGDEQQTPDCVWSPGHMKTGDFLKEFPDWFLKGEKRPSQKRYTFTTWNYFTKDSILEPSGLIGPVKLLIEA